MNFHCVFCGLELELLKKKSYTCPKCGLIMYPKEITKNINRERVEQYIFEKQEEVTPETVRGLLEEEFKIRNKYKKEEIWDKIKDLFEAFFGLLRDPDARWDHKVLSAVAILYLVAPIDLIPDVIPVIGYLDDLFIFMLIAAQIGSALIAYSLKKGGISSPIPGLPTKRVYYFYPPNIPIKTKSRYRESLLISLLSLHPEELEKFGLSVYGNNIVQPNRLYVAHPYLYRTLVPLDKFDRILVEDILREELEIFAALGAKNIRWEKVEAKGYKVRSEVDFGEAYKLKTSEKKDQQEGEKILESINGIGLSFLVSKNNFSREVKYREFGENTSFDLSVFKQLVWFFTGEQSFPSVIRNRVLNDMLHENLTCEYNTENYLGLDARLEIQKIIKKIGISCEFNIKNHIMSQINYTVEFYPSPNKVKENPHVVWEQIQTILEQRRSEIEQQSYKLPSDVWANYEKLNGSQSVS